MEADVLPVRYARSASHHLSRAAQTAPQVITLSLNRILLG